MKVNTKNKINEASTFSNIGFTPFQISSQDLESDKEMLLETAMENLDAYIIDRIGSSNLDLNHDRILISQNETDQSEKTIVMDQSPPKVSKVNSVTGLISQDMTKNIGQNRSNDAFSVKEAP